MIPDYYNGPPDQHPNNDAICDLEDERERLQKELDDMDALIELECRDATNAEERRAVQIENRLEEIEGEIKTLTENEDAS